MDEDYSILWDDWWMHYWTIGKVNAEWLYMRLTAPDPEWEAFKRKYPHLIGKGRIA